MKPYKNYIMEEKSEGGYISLSVADESAERIEDVLSEFEINGLIQQFHLTLMYDVSNPSVSYKTNDLTYESDIVDIKILGEEDSEWRAIAFELSDNTLVTRHQELLSQGFNHSYDTFIPHVSIKYKPSEKDIKTLTTHKEYILKQIGIIKLTHETREPIKV